MTDSVHSSDDALAEALACVHEAAQSLLGAPGLKALLRRFGDVLEGRLGIRSFDCARLSGRGDRAVLKRRGVRCQGLEPFDDATLAGLATMLGGAGKANIELRDGCTDLVVDGQALLVTVVDDALGPNGTIVVWPATPPGVAPHGLPRAVLDQLVRVLQNEARWLRKLDKAQAMLYRDDLTGLYNTRYLEFALDAELRRAERFGNQFCLLFIDLDGFKPINDSHGHLAGSSVLRQVADVLREAVREVDVPIRYGGDEFVVLLLGAACAKGLLAAERVRRRIEAKEFQIDGGITARVTASIGIAAFPEHGRDRETLLKMADETMYDSKRAGKNRVTVVGRGARLI